MNILLTALSMRLPAAQVEGRNLVFVSHHRSKAGSFAVCLRLSSLTFSFIKLQALDAATA